MDRENKVISGFGLTALVSSVDKALKTVDRCTGPPVDSLLGSTVDVFLALPMANGHEFVIGLTPEAFSWRNEVEIATGVSPEAICEIRRLWLKRQGKKEDMYTCRVVRDSALDGLLPKKKRKDKGKGKADGSPSKKART